MEKLIARKNLKYPAMGGVKLKPGDEFMAHAKDVRVLVDILGKAARIPPSKPAQAAPKAMKVEPPKPEPAQPAEPAPPASRQTYQHRAMMAEESGLVPSAAPKEPEPSPPPQVPRPYSHAEAMASDLGQMTKRELLDIAVEEMVVHSTSDRVSDLIDKIVKHRMTKESQ